MQNATCIVSLAAKNPGIYMKRYVKHIVILLLFGALNPYHSSSQPNIGTYPPQIHQQICQESTFTRYLDVFNTGNATLYFTATYSPGPVGWVTASPLSGQIPPGDTIQIEFFFNSAGLPIDNYYNDLVISSNDPDDPDHAVLAMLHVQDLTILLNPDQDSICLGCSTKLNTIVFGCSEMYTYSWTSEPPGFSSTEKSPVVSPEVTTIYTVTVTDGGYSKQNSVEIKVEATTGLNDNEIISGLSIFPNPGNGLIKLKFYSDYDVAGKVHIADLAGRIIQSGDIYIMAGMNELAVWTGSIRKGVYLLSVQGDNHSVGSYMLNEKIVIQ